MRQVRAFFKLLALVLLTTLTYLMLLGADLSGLKKSSFKASVKRWSQRMVARICNIHIHKEGNMVAGPALLIGNHVSYVDVNVLWASADHDITFTPKSDVRGWPILGEIVRRFDVVFVDRTPAKTKVTQAQLQDELHRGKVICIFAEATTGNGREMRPFKSSLFSLAEQWNEAEPLAIQPVTVVYESVDGAAMNEENWPRIAWYGDADFSTHFWSLLCNAKINVRVRYHTPVAMQKNESRKEVAERVREIVKNGNPHHHSQIENTLFSNEAAYVT